MNNQKILLYVSLAMGSMFIYEKWVSPREVVAPRVVTEAPVMAHAPTAAQVLTITTPNAKFSIDKNTSHIVGASLLKYKNSLNAAESVDMFNSSTDSPLIASLGLDDELGGVWVASKWEGSQGVLVGRLPSGLAVEKHYSTTEDGYSLKVKIRVSNPTAVPVQTQFSMRYEAEKRQVQNGTVYPQPDSFVAGSPAGPNASWFAFNTFTGLSYHDSQKAYSKITYSKLAKNGINKTVREPWLSIQKRYFVTAIVPSFDRSYELQGLWTQGMIGDSHYDQRLNASLNSKQVTLASGEVSEQELILYAGPEDAAILKTIAPGLDLTIDFGVFWILCEGLLWVLQGIYGFCQNWGWSIVLLTVLLRLVFYKMSEKGFQSMQKLKLVGPQVTVLQETYKDDDTKKNQAVMQLYQKEGINPLSGCLPALLPLPFMMALYYVLLEAIQLRHVPFLWLTDLSAPDPLFILPVVMTVSMYIQQSLTPMDESQKPMMMLMPLVIGYMSSQFPSGLALFYFVNTVLGLLQQWWFISRHSK